MRPHPQFDYKDNQYQIRPLADRIFNRSRGEARMGWIKALFTGKMRMPVLSNRLAGRIILGQYSLGMHSIEIDRIVGTESRANDFDADFNPRHDRIRERWTRIAELRLSRSPSLPSS